MRRDALFLAWICCYFVRQRLFEASGMSAMTRFFFFFFFFFSLTTQTLFLGFLETRAKDIRGFRVNGVSPRGCFKLRLIDCRVNGINLFL